MQDVKRSSTPDRNLDGLEQREFNRQTPNFSQDLHKTLQPEQFNGANATIEEGVEAEPKPRFTKLQKLVATVLAITFFGGVGIFGNKLMNNKNNNSDIMPQNPTEQINELSKLPKEAQVFIDQYGSRYQDPVSTYYAEMNYKKNINESGVVMTDDFINSFEISHLTHGDKSVLGFTAYELPLSAENNQETAVDVFNTYTAKNLSDYMNRVAKNPSRDALAIIDSEFQNYCSNTGSDNQENTAFLFDNEPIEMLMDTAKDIVAKYGSAANYSVAPAAIDTSDPNMTSFPRGLFVGKRKYLREEITSLHIGGVNLVVNVDIYDGDSVIQKKETLKDKQLSIIRQPFMGHTVDGTDYTYISIGQEL